VRWATIPAVTRRRRVPLTIVVRQYAIGKGHSVSVLWRGGEVDTIFGFEKEADALQWIKEKSQGWLVEHKKLG
jgi:hypothetical protein